MRTLAQLRADCEQHLAGMGTRRGKRWTLYLDLTGKLVRCGAESRRTPAHLSGIRMVGVYTSAARLEQLVADVRETARVVGLQVHE